jgi:hypothetical protein
MAWKLAFRVRAFRVPVTARSGDSAAIPGTQYQLGYRAAKIPVEWGTAFTPETSHPDRPSPAPLRVFPSPAWR